MSLGTRGVSKCMMAMGCICLHSLVVENVLTSLNAVLISLSHRSYIVDLRVHHLCFRRDDKQSSSVAQHLRFPSTGKKLLIQLCTHSPTLTI